MLAIQAPYSNYFDLDGSPLTDGEIFFGQPSQNPETAPITVYWDSALTQPASQPLETLNGYIVRNGTPAQIYSLSNCSVTVRNAKGAIVYTSAILPSFDTSAPRVVSSIAALRQLPKTGSANVNVTGYYVAGDRGGGSYYYDASDTASSDNGGTVIVGTDGGRWKLASTQPVTIRQFGAKGDGTTNDTTAAQSFLTAIRGKHGFIQDGTYICGTLTISSGTTLIGYSRLNTIIKANAALSVSQPLLINATISGTVDTYPDTDISIYGITFDGSNTSSRTVELVSFIKTRRVVFDRCCVRNVSYIGLAFGGSREMRIRDTNFSATGNPIVTSEGGPALWFGNAGDGSASVDGLVQGCSFSSLEWAGIYGSANRLKIIGNDFNGVKEAAIFTGANTEIVIKGNTIDGVTKKYISGSGIETGGSYVNISGNVIKNVANCNIALTDTQQVTISGNTLSECRQDSTSFPQGSGIGVVTTQTAPNQPAYINVSGNTFTSFGSNPYSFFTIGGAGDAGIDILVEGNDAGGNTFSSGKAFKVEGKWGGNCIHRNNIGAADSDPVVGTFQTNGSTGSQSITGIGFKPRRLELLATTNTATAIQQCNAVVDASGNCGKHSIASSGGVSFGGPATTINTTCISVPNSSGVAQVAATFTSYDDDGFTINITTATTQAIVRYVAYP